jgi:hypothetical protein
MLGSKALGSSLTSQIAAKSAAICEARLKNLVHWLTIILWVIFSFWMWKNYDFTYNIILKL